MSAKWQLQLIMAAIFSTGFAAMPLAQEYDEFLKKCYANGLPDSVIASCSAVIARRLVDKEDLASAYRNRGDAYDDKGDFVRALDDYGQAVAINPQDADVFNSRGTTHTALGRYDRAVQDFDQAIRINPASPMAFSNRCYAKALLGQLKEGLADCNEALRVKPRSAGAYAARGFVYLKMKRYDAAIADYNAELKIAPNDPYSLFGRGVARQLRGDLRGGDGDLVAAQAVKPDIADHMAKLGVSLSDLR